MNTIAVIIPAAGFGRRMRGRDKLLEPIDGVALLTRVVSRACAVSREVIVTLPVANPARRACLSDSPATLVEVPEAFEGMAASIRRAMTQIPARSDGVMILPADMPDLTQQDLALVCQQFEALGKQQLCCGASAAGHIGHPVIFPTDCFEALGRITGDHGGRTILMQNNYRLNAVHLPNKNAVTDLDSPEDWRAWRATSLYP